MNNIADNPFLPPLLAGLTILGFIFLVLYPTLKLAMWIAEEKDLEPFGVMIVLLIVEFVVVTGIGALFY